MYLKSVGILLVCHSYIKQKSLGDLSNFLSVTKFALKSLFKFVYKMQTKTAKHKSFF